MPSSRWTLVSCALALLVAGGCSDGSDGIVNDPRAQDIAIIEPQLPLALPLMADLIGRIAPTIPAASPQARASGDPCGVVDRGDCETGTISECPTLDPDVVEVRIDQCTQTQGTGGGLVVSFDGLLTYSAGQDWPAGTFAMVLDDGMPGTIRYDTTLDGTSAAQIEVDDTVNDAVATCIGDLVAPFAADCY